MPNSNRSTHLVPRPPMPRPFDLDRQVSARIMLDPEDTEKFIAMIREAWEADIGDLHEEIADMRRAVHNLRPWYSRLAEWWRGR